jgi:hypothetical protein
MTKRAKRPRSARKLSTLDDFLAKEGKREEFEAMAVKEVLARLSHEAEKANEPRIATPLTVPLSSCGRGQRSVARKRMVEGWRRS